MLILCEKPSAANDFAKALSCDKRKGYYRNNNAVITYCVGHLFELSKPERYNPSYKIWDRKYLPIIPQVFKYEIIPENKAQAEIVISFLKQFSEDSIIIATDAGREGELIARIVLAEAGISDISRIKRFWSSEALTKEVILSGLENAQSLSAYDALFREGMVRQKADWLIGINLTRYMTIGNTTLFSVGRVQTALLNAIATRNEEVSSFAPIPFNELEGSFKTTNGTIIKGFLVNPKNEKKTFFDEREYLLNAQRYCREHPISATYSKVTKERQHPEKLLNITALQKLGFKHYGYAPHKTLELAQSLYETHKCLSYPRTPSRVMGDNDVDFFKEKYAALSAAYPDYAKYCDKSLVKKENRNIFDSRFLEDHHALIPLKALPAEATAEERNIFDLVVKSFFMVCMPDYLFNKKEILFHVGDYIFHSCTHEVIQNGFRDFLSEKTEQNSEIQETPLFDENSCELVKVDILRKETKPRSQFSIDTLLAFMENPHNETNEKLSGLGTPATRAAIIKTLFERGYIREEKKKLYAAHKGLFLLKQLKKDPELARITDVTETTQWEACLKENPEIFEESITAYISSCIKTGNKDVFEEESIGSCPICGKPIVERKKGFFCSGHSAEAPCKMAVWKEVMGTSLTADDVKQLLSHKPTHVKKCVSREGKKFSASFFLETDGALSFKFADSRKRKG